MPDVGAEWARSRMRFDKRTWASVHLDELPAGGCRPRGEGGLEITERPARLNDKFPIPITYFRKAILNFLSIFPFLN